MSLEIRGDGIPVIKKLFERSPGLGLQALNGGMLDVREKMVADSESAGTHRYEYKFEDGYRRIKLGKSDRWGRRSRKTNAKQKGLGHLIRGKLYLLSHTAIVGFADTKSYYGWSFRGGVAKRGTRIKGTMTKRIAQFVHDGGRQHLTARQKYLFRKSGLGGAAARGYVDHKPSRFMRMGYYKRVAADRAVEEFNKAVKEVAA